MSEPGLPDVERLRWQCRRGMLELDYLFMEFIEKGYEALPTAGKLRFVKLLDYPDPMLQGWFFGEMVPSDPDLRELIATIRNAI